jgi:DNA modification methylase
MCGSGTTLKMAKLNNRNYVGIDITDEYVDLSKRRVEGLVPYTEENPNPKVKFLLSKEDALAKRKKKVEVEIDIEKEEE